MLNNLLEGLTELRKTVYLLGYQFIMKGYSNSQTEELHRTRYGGRGAKLP